MATTSTKLTPAEHLEQRMLENREWAEKWRAENGDPGEALARLLVEQFGLDAFKETYQEFLDHEDAFLFDDYDHEIEEERTEDGGPAR